MLLGSQLLKHRGYPEPHPNQRVYVTQQQVQQTVLGPCFDCGGPHLVRGCPNRKQTPNANPGTSTTIVQRVHYPPVERYYEGCCAEHFPKDCPLKPTMALTP